MKRLAHVAIVICSASLLAPCFSCSTDHEPARASMSCIEAAALPERQDREVVDRVLAAMAAFNIAEPYKTGDMMREILRDRPDAAEAIAEAIRGYASQLGGITHEMLEPVRLMQALLWMGDAAEPAVPELIKLLEDDDDDEHVSAFARDALVQIGRPAALALVQEVERGTPAERDRALDALGRMGPKGKSAVPRLLRLLGKEEEDDATTLRLVTASWASDPQALRCAGAARSRIVRLAPEADVPVASQAVAVLGACDADPLEVVAVVVRHPVRVHHWMKATVADPAGEWGRAMASVYALHALGRRALPTLLDTASKDDDVLFGLPHSSCWRTAGLARA